MKTLQSILLAALLAGFAFTVSARAEGIINVGLLQSPDNLDQELVLTEVPLNVTEAYDTLTIQWTPEVEGTLVYTLGPPSDDLEDYDELADPLGSGPGSVTLIGNQLPVGMMSCLIVSGEEMSTYFVILRAADVAPELIGPLTPAGGEGIEDVSPEFSWEPVNGVPYYLVFVADQPFEITEDEDGETVVQGANIIWQAITSETSIQYGVEDPSGSIDNDLTPPLIGDDTEPYERPRYNWTVLNCYDNNIAFTSNVFGAVAGFEVETAAPFDEPVLITPESNADLFDDEILFQWSGVPESNSYLFYLSQYQTYANGTEILFPVWQIQTTDNAVVCPASAFLQDNRYIWKVIASDDQGFGALSDTLAFEYHLESGHMVIHTENAQGDPLDLVQVEFEVVNGPGILPVITDEDGEYSRDYPVGTYILHASKDGYIDTETDPVTITAGASFTETITLTPQESAISGMVIDQDGDGVGGATVHCDPTQGPTVTATTNASGSFYRTVDPDLYELTASANGFQNSSPVTVNVQPGETVYLEDDDLQVNEYTYTLSGQVTNPSNQPIHLAEVSVYIEGEEFSQYTDASGLFSFTLGNGYWTLEANKESFYLDSGPIQVLIADDDVEQDVILVPQEGVISGFTYLNGSIFTDDDLQVRATPSAGEPVFVDVGGAGGFSIGVPSDNYEVVGILEGFTGDPVSVTVGPGQSVSGIQVNMTPNPSSISGTITTPGGSPIQSATVSAGEVQATTNASGSYSLQVSAGTHVVTAQKDGYSTTTSPELTVDYGENLTNVNLQMSPNVATVSGQVASYGVGVIGATVTATPSGPGDPVSLTTGTGGTYSFGLNPGSYTLTASKSGFIVLEPTQYELSLQPGATVSNRNFSIVPNTGVVSGTVTGPGGPLYSANVTVREVGLNQGGQTITTGVGGTFSVTVEQGYAYDVIATKTGYTQETVTTGVVEPDGEENVQVELEALGGSFAGKVWNPEQTPIVNATVVAIGPEEQFSATTNNSGNYTISLPPGTYEIDVSAAGYFDLFEELTVNPGEDLTGVNWTVEPNFALIAGFVLDADGNDIGNATVTLTKQGGTTRTTVSDEGGFYQFTNLTTGVFTATAQKSGFVTQSLELGLVVDGQEIEDADFSMEEAASNFTGTITSEGVGIADATVNATSENDEVFTTISGANGSYEISGIGAGTYTLQAQRSGYTGFPVEDQTVEPGQTATVNISLIENDGTITGTVISTNDVTLSGVSIAAEATGTGHYYQAMTSADGTFSLSGIYPETTYDLTFTKTGYGTESFEDVDDGDDLEVVMVPNALEISGTTVNQIGDNMAAIPLRATNLSDGTISNVTSNENGQFTFTEIATNTEYAIVTLTGANNIVDASINLTMGVSDTSGVQLTLIEQTASIAGNASTSGVNITGQRQGGGTKSTFTDAEGGYVLNNLREGNWTLTPSKQGYIFDPATQDVNNLGVGEARTGVNFSATSTNIDVGGTVVDDVGEPMAGVTVKLVSAGQTRMRTSDENGEFFYDEIPGLTEYDLFAEFAEDGYSSEVIYLDTETEDVLNQEINVTISLGMISGTVTDAETGDNLNQFNVQIDNNEPQTFGGGTFSFDGFQLGTYTLTITKADYENVVQDVTLQSGLDTVSVDIEMTPIPDGIHVTVRDTLAGGGEERPLYGALGIIRLTGEFIDSLRSDVSGGIQFTGLDVGETYEIELRRRGYQTATIYRQVGNEPHVTLAASPGYVIGTMKGRQGELFYANGTVYLRAQNGENRTQQTDDWGGFAIEAFPGPMTTIASDSTDSTTSYLYSLSVPPGTSVHRAFQLRTTGQIEGTVLTDDGEPPASRGLIETTNFSQGTYAFRRTAPDGSYRVRGLRPGDFLVTATVDGYDDPDDVNLTLAAGDTATADFTVFNPVTSIVGVVYRGDSEDGIANAQVRAEGPDTLTTSSTGEGDFSFIDITPGAYLITASKLGYHPQSSEITVEEGDVGGVELRLEPIVDQATGFVFDTDGETPLSDIDVELRDGDADTLITSATTDAEGVYSFDLTAQGYYVVRPIGSFAPAERGFEHQFGSAHTDLNFTRVLEQGFGSVTGSVVWRNQPLSGVTVELDQLAGPLLYTTTTDNEGAFEFEANSPARYRLRAISDMYGTITSGGFQLETGQTVERTLVYDSGQIGVTVVDADDAGVESVPVFITSADGQVSLSLLTEANGRAVSEPNLPNGTYTIEIISPQDLLGPFPVTLEITEGDSVGLRIPHGWAFTAPASVNIGDQIPVEVEVPDSYTIESALLYYRNIGENFYRSLPMTPAGGQPRSIGGGTRAGGEEIHGDRGRGRDLVRPGGEKGGKEPAGARSRGRMVLSREDRVPLRSGSGDGRSPRTHGTSGAQGSDDIVLYTAMIPAQYSAGELLFYPQLATASGITVGRQEDASTVQVSNIGIVETVEIRPPFSELQPGVPKLLTMRSYDALGNRVTADDILDAGGSITWEAAVEGLELPPDTPEQAVYQSSGEGADTVSVSVVQPLNEQTAVQKISELAFENRIRIIDALSVSAPNPHVEAGDSIKLTVSATDTGGSVMQVVPEWHVDTGGSVASDTSGGAVIQADGDGARLGTLYPIPYTQFATFVADSGRVGKVDIRAVDPFSGMEAVFNEQREGIESGLNVKMPIKSGPGRSYSFGDGADLSVQLQFTDDARTGNDGYITLSRPTLVDFQKYRVGLEALAAKGYSFALEDNLNEAKIGYTVTLPIPSLARDRNPKVARWSVTDLAWYVFDDSFPSVDDSTITLQLDPNEDGSLVGTFSVVADTKPLGIDDLVFNPNPFSPYGDYPLSIEVTLNSKYPSDVWVRIDIYNMVGTHVRTLKNDEPMKAGRYAREGAQFNSIAKGLTWDGLTDGGRMARNGRYLVRINVRDADGEEEKLETVVLIK